MLGKFFKKKKAPARRLEHPKDLKAGDIITLKPRSVLPTSIEGATLTVKAVTTYEYSDGLLPEFTLESQEGKIYSMSYESEDEGDTLCFSRKLKHDEITALFDEEQLGELWGEDLGDLEVNDAEAELQSWLPDSYRQTIKDATAYFYNEDRRDKESSQYVDDNSQELRYHECEGSPDQFSLNIEIWEDGDTDIFVQVTVPVDVIEEMWPNAD